MAFIEGTIDFIKDKDTGEIILPETVTNAVYDSVGNRLDNTLNEINSTLDELSKLKNNGYGVQETITLDTNYVASEDGYAIIEISNVVNSIGEIYVNNLTVARISSLQTGTLTTFPRTTIFIKKGASFKLKGTNVRLALFVGFDHMI